MYYPDSYNTTIGSIFNLKETVKSLKEAIIMTGPHNHLDTKSLDGIIPYYVIDDSSVKMFSHPILLEHDGSKYMCTDLRMVMRKDINLENISSSIKNLTEYNFAKSRTILNMYWAAGDTTNMKISLVFAEAVYVLWLSDAISKAYALDPQDRLIISIAISYFYQTLFVDKDDINEDFVQLAAAHTIKITDSDSGLVFDVIDKLVNVNNINDLTETLGDIVQTNRLKNFNLAALLTIVKNSWYGLNAKEVISIALEHPPTWSAVVFTAITEKTYKNSQIARLGEMLGRRNKSDEFIKNILYMLDSQKELATEELDYRLLSED